MNLKNVGCCCFQPPRPARALAQVGVTFGHGTALPWSWEPQRGAGGPWGGEDSNEESGIPSASPPPEGSTEAVPRGMPCLAEGKCWHARSGAGRLQLHFLLRQVYFVSPGAAQRSQPHGAGLRWGESRGGQRLFSFLSRRLSQMTQIPKRSGQGGDGGCVSWREAARCAPAALGLLPHGSAARVQPHGNAAYATRECFAPR